MSVSPPLCWLVSCLPPLLYVFPLVSHSPTAMCVLGPCGVMFSCIPMCFHCPHHPHVYLCGLLSCIHCQLVCCFTPWFHVPSIYVSIFMFRISSCLCLVFPVTVYSRLGLPYAIFVPLKKKKNQPYETAHLLLNYSFVSNCLFTLHTVCFC